MTTDLANRLENAKAQQDAGLAPGAQKASVLGWLTAPGTPMEIAAALPKGQDEKRWLRIIQTEIRRNPKLLEADYRSFALAVLMLAQLGLEPGPLGHSYLTGPFRNNKTGIKEVVPIIGYKGLIDLAYRADTVDLIDAVPVHEGEPFRIVRGSEQRLEHEELASCAQNKVVAYYAIAFPKGSGRAVFEVMWAEDIEAIRKRSRAKDDGPWKTDFEAMALKSPIRRMLNRGKVRLSPQVAATIAEDEAREFGFERPELLSSLTPEAPAAEGEGRDTSSPGDPSTEPGLEPAAGTAIHPEEQAPEQPSPSSVTDFPRSPKAGQEYVDGEGQIWKFDHGGWYAKQPELEGN